MSDTVSRKALRHLIMRRRNERIVADQRAVEMPAVIHLHPDTRDEILMDNDPNEMFTVDFEGREFLGIPLQGDPALERGVFVVVWPTS